MSKGGYNVGDVLTSTGEDKEFLYVRDSEGVGNVGFRRKEYDIINSEAEPELTDRELLESVNDRLGRPKSGEITDADVATFRETRDAIAGDAGSDDAAKLAGGKRRTPPPAEAESGPGAPPTT